MVREVLEGTGNRVATAQVFGLEVRAIGRQDEPRLGLGGGWADLQGAQCLRHLAGIAGQDVDVVGLKDAAQVGLVRCTGTQTLEGRFLVAKGFKEGIGELCGVEGLLRKVSDGLFDLDGVQRFGS